MGLPAHASRWAVLPLLALLALAPGGKEADTGWVVHRDAGAGFTVRHPAAWHLASEPVARLMDPREILSVATFPLRHQATNCEAFGGAARTDLGPGDVFVTVLERGYEHGSHWRDFPARPAHFGPAGTEAAEPACGDPPGTSVHWRNFTDAGRHFHTLVAIGPDAPAVLRRQAWAVLDSLRLDAGHPPTWESSG